MKTIVLDAEPFCFGPISTTLNVARELRRLPESRDARLVLLGTLTSRQLAEASGVMDDIVECDTSSEASLLARRELLESASLYIANTNFQSVRILRQHEVDVPIAFIDTLFWMWDRLDPILDSVDVYIAQDFWGVRDRVARLPEGTRRVAVVQPLIRMARAQADKRDLIVINLGGIENIYNRQHYHARDLAGIVLETIRAEPALDQYEKVVCGGGHVIDAIRRDFEDPARRVRVGCFRQDAYLDMLAASRFLFTLPGLTSLVESVYYGANAFLLLPQNYSQYLQLELARRHMPAVRGKNWNDLQGFPEIHEYEEELAAVRKVQECNRIFFSSPDLVGNYCNHLRSFLLDAGGASGGAVHLPFFDPSVNGPEQAARQLLAVARGPRGGGAPGGSSREGQSGYSNGRQP